MRILADTNIVAQAVRNLRTHGHDVVYAAERAVDPGDTTLLSEAVLESRLFLTKDHDVGALVFRDFSGHRGVLLVDDLGNPEAESALVLSTVGSYQALLVADAFLRAGAGGVRAVKP